MYKYFGRLAGSTQSGQTLTESSPINSNTPFDPLVPATKFIAYGEDANSSTYNRALSALANNIDDLAGVLDAPALRYEVLEPDPAPNNQASYGNSNLVSLASMINVANLGQGARRPVSWVFVGLHQSKVGDFLQLERVGGGADNQIHTPVTVFQNSLAALYFPVNPNYPANAGQHGAPDLIPGITPIVTDLPPYNGASLTTGIASWDADGCYLSAADPGQANQYSWKDLYLQPGCFVFVEGGNAQQNRGLYRIASLTGGTSSATSKAVLTNALTKVTIATAAEANFPVGSRVSWRSRPNQTAASTEVTRTHRAYVMYKDVPAAGGFAYLYLANFSGGTDFPVQGSTSFKAIPGHNGTETFNQFGLLELEVGAGQNANLVLSTGVGTGTTLHGTGGSTETLSVLPAGVTPPFLAGSHGAQTIMPHSPPGFVLNPSISLGGGANQIGGTFRAHCHVLTTVRDNLLSGGLSVTRGSSSMFGRSQFSPGYKSVLERFARWAHVGDVPDAQVALTNSHLLSSEFGPTRQVMGHGLYAVVFSAPPAGLTAGSVITLDQPAGTNQVKAVVVSVAGSLVVLKNVVSLVESVSYQRDPIKVNQVISGQPAITVVSAYRPDLHSASWQNPGVYTPFYPSEGLDAAYHADYSSNPFLRGQAGQGNRIYSIGNRPITMVLPSLGDTDIGFQVESNRQANGQSYTVLRAGPVGVGTGDLALDVVDGTALRIKDGNATTGVLFSGTGASQSVLTQPYVTYPAYPTSIIGAINRNVGAADILNLALTSGVLLGCTVTASNPQPLLSLDVAVGLVIANNGQIKELGPFTGLPLGPNEEGYLVWNGSQLVKVVGLSNVTNVPLAWFKTNQTSVVEVRDLRLLVNAQDRRVDLHVGGPAAHFSTVGAAVDFVKYYGKAFTGKRTWRILVRGSTTETATITMPSGVVIEGFGETTEVVWGGSLGFDTLFDLNGSDDLVFRNLHFVYQNGAAPQATTTTQRTLFRNGGQTNSDAILLEGITCASNTAGRLSSYISVDNVDRLTIRDCRFTGATDVGFSISKANHVLIDNTHVLGSYDYYGNNAVNPQVVSPYVAGVAIHATAPDLCRDVQILNCRVEFWRQYGIRVVRSERVHIGGCVVEDIFGTGAEFAQSIYVAPNQNNLSVSVVDCRLGLIDQIGNGAPSISLEMGGTYGHVRGNNISPIHMGSTTTGILVTGSRTVVTGNQYLGSVADPPNPPVLISPGVDQKAVVVTGSYNILDANQAGGCGIDNQGVNNSIGAMNRDDA